MSPVDVQFAVGAHVLAVLGYHCDTLVTSDVVARSVNVDASFARRCFANLRRAGLVRTRRGKGGASTLARPAEDISLLDVYAACDARPRPAVHHYMVEPTCPVSSDIWPVLSRALGAAQQEFERALAARTVADLVQDIRQREASGLEHRPASRSCRRRSAATCSIEERRSL